MIQKPAISVIIIVKNGEAYLKDSIHSVIQQTYAPAEIIIIDGGSQDRTAEIAKSFPEVRYQLQENSGIPAAYNQGIRSAKGEYLAFNSCDDIWLPQKLERQINLFKDDSSLQLVITHVQFFAEDPEKVPNHFRKELFDKPVPGFVMETVLAKKSIFMLTGLFNPELPVAEDTDWFAKIIDMKIPYSVIPEVLVNKRIHTSNATFSPSIQNSALLLKVLRDSLKRKRNE